MPPTFLAADAADAAALAAFEEAGEVARLHGLDQRGLPDARVSEQLQLDARYGVRRGNQLVDVLLPKVRLRASESAGSRSMQRVICYEERCRIM